MTFAAMIGSTLAYALQADGSSAMGYHNIGGKLLKPHEARGNKWHLKPSRYSGEEIRRLNAERGVGSARRVAPETRATFIASPHPWRTAR